VQENNQICEVLITDLSFSVRLERKLTGNNYFKTCINRSFSQWRVIISLKLSVCFFNVLIRGIVIETSLGLKMYERKTDKSYASCSTNECHGNGLLISIVV